MPAAYGFKATDPNDALAISTLMSQSDSVSEKRYDTLAQYRINDVQLKPASLSLGLPRQWMLTMNTTMTGFNRPNNQPLFFRKDKDPVGDGYVTYPISSREFSDMVRGGLYDNPRGYMSQLRNGLVKKEFFRKTNVTLTAAHVANERTTVSAGDLRQRPKSGRDYLIGTDLNSYAAYGPEKDLHSNLAQLLKQQTDILVQNPVKKREATKAPQATIQHEDLPELSDIHINSEVDLKIDKERLDRLRSLDHVDESQAASPSTEQPDSQAASQASEESMQSSQTKRSKAVVANSEFESSAESSTPASQPASASNRAEKSSSSVSSADDGPKSSEEPKASNRFDLPDSNPNENSQSSATQRRNRVRQETEGAPSASQSPQGAPQKPQPQAKPKAEQPQSVDNNVSLDDIMNQLTGGADSQASPMNQRRRHQRVYVDDFGEALQDSKASQEAKLNKRRNLQRQHDAAEHSGPDL